jgi:diaminohydroxyphosphoribosylaminopyrimidine deaminase / 5-amino-6-(5-phosphoribosylamino)uracil reductase
MRHALAIAERGRGSVEPNPMVGAVVLDSTGQLVGTGWHQKFGAAHAEVNAFAEAGTKAKDGTLIVTLEPCCHRGKTPPCTDAVLRSGVRRVIVAMADPFLRVAGGGLDILRSAGLEVEVGLCETEARRLNAPYLKLLRTGRPWVHLKWAMTLDGKISTRTGDSKWISGEESRALVHALRGRVDAVIVGRGTVLADDPLLTARPLGPRVPLRIVLSSSGDLPAQAQLLSTAREFPVMIVTAIGNKGRLAAWSAAGCEVLALPAIGGQVSVDAVLAELGRRRMTNVLVEGGAGVIGCFLDERAADELHVFIAPLLAGGERALSPAGGLGVERIAESLGLEPLSAVPFGPDIYIHGFVRSP